MSLLSPTVLQHARGFVDIASVRIAPDPDSRLGPREYGDFLPGLGDLYGWPLTHDNGRVGGVLLGGFEDNSVGVLEPGVGMVMLELRGSHAHLELSSLEPLRRLPQGILRRLQLASFAHSTHGLVVMHSATVVAQTKSIDVARFMSALASHLLADRTEIVDVERLEGLRPWWSSCSKGAVLRLGRRKLAGDTMVEDWCL